MRSDPLRVGVIGASALGGWGSEVHVPVIKALPQIQLKGICNAHVATAREAARKFGAELAFDDAHELAAHPDIDAVAVCVRVPRHMQLVEVALQCGKPVYCEWPLARDAAEAEAMIGWARRAGVANMVGLQGRFAPALAYVRDLLLDGAIGDVHATTLIHSRSWFIEVAGMEYLQDAASGADFLAVAGGHSVDAVCSVLGEFMSVEATMTRIERGTGIGGTAANQIVIAGMLSNGALACIRLQGAPGHGTGLWWEINGSRGDLVIAAERAGIQLAHLSIRRTIAPSRFEDLAVPDRGTDIPEAVRSAPLLNVARAWMAFHEAITRGRRARPDFSDALARHCTLEAVRRASASGGRVTLGQDCRS